MVDRYAKYAMEHLAVAANRLQRVRDDNVINLVRLRHVLMQKGPSHAAKPLIYLVGPAGVEPTTNGLKVRCSTN